MEFEIKGYYIIANEKTREIVVQRYLKGKLKTILAEGLPDYIDEALENGDEYSVMRYVEELIDRRID